jgi:hypothetical protein
VRWETGERKREREKEIWRQFSSLEMKGVPPHSKLSPEFQHQMLEMKKA